MRGETKEERRENVIKTVQLSNELGFVIHPIKSEFEPYQVIEYLGFILNSIDMTIKVNNRQITKI